MSWTIPKSGGGKAEKAPAGNHLAILVGLIDMGRQWQEPFNATKDKGYWAWRAYFVWELTEERIAGTGTNHVIAIDLSHSTNEKSKLRKWVEARTGRPLVEPFDPTTELGQACLLNVVMKGDYPRVEGMAALPKGFAVPRPTYPVTAVSLAEFRAGTPVPEWVPYLFGSPLEDHIRACEQIGGQRPRSRKKAEPASVEGGYEEYSDAADVPF
ncbi:phage replication initiation protein, NGO0469 family [Frigoriglobus tundricola]|uniref:Uncharacterized protein n=1 Tax=Frigoriglobus tundricola TaxID=2774151 RepID=A0A6M5YZF9_9BACT|nr:hypothetical protein [Frigoriglobus tundricola]QJW98613.1 hypothetical protein FTUN_6208 [Frigoriglobus tundricola]